MPRQVFDIRMRRFTYHRAYHCSRSTSVPRYRRRRPKQPVPIVPSDDESTSDGSEDYSQSSSISSQKSKKSESRKYVDLTSLADSCSRTTPEHDIEASIATSHPHSEQGDSDSEWETSSDRSNSTRFFCEDQKTLIRREVPASTEGWTITPTAWFKRQDMQDADARHLCDQCARIDFKAIFAIEVDDITEGGGRTCSFSGLSRAMLSSSCLCCKTFATIAYGKHNSERMNASSLSNSTYQGYLLALSSNMHQSYGGEVIVLRLELLCPGANSQTDSWVQLWGSIMPIAAPDSEYVNTQTLKAFGGFNYAMPLEEQVNWQRISTMVHRCQQFHPSCRDNHGLEYPRRAKFIDCKTRRVVIMTDDLPYIALSYVWGPRDIVNDFGMFQDTHVSQQLPGNLPQLMEDAMYATTQLGYQYLWVDYFCVDQYHAADKLIQIQQMANIYSHASVTICALDASPELGLPGISRPRSTSATFRSDGVSYVCIPDPESMEQNLRESAWIRRGWTLQEAILSRRCLFLTDEQSSLICRFSHQTETLSSLSWSQWSKSRREIWYWGSGMSIYLAATGGRPQQGSLTFQQAVDNYQTRHLSYESDALHAFKGLLSLAPTRSYFGILLSRRMATMDSIVAFTKGLLWNTISKKSGSAGQAIREGFPSWTWLSRKHYGISFAITGHLSSFGVEDNPHEFRPSEPYANFLRKTWVANIWTTTLEGKSISMAELLQKYEHGVIPEQSQVLRLQSVTMRYRSAYRQFSSWGSSGAAVVIDPSVDLPFDIVPSSSSFSAAEMWRYDDDLHHLQPVGASHLAILILGDAPDDPFARSYWLALKPVCKKEGRQFYRRDGLIVSRGWLRWKGSWESVLRQDIWLT